jgi:creatinine amidohydrolase
LSVLTVGSVPDEPVWNRLTAAQLRELAARDAVVLLPIGSTE